MIYLRLFYEFFKTGLFSIGGGMATLPFLADMGERTGWFTSSQLADMVAVSESTPGPVGINMATYVGYNSAGVGGSLVATLGIVTPSIIVILIIALFLRAFRNNKYVDRVFYGIRPASTGLIASAGLSLIILCLVDTAAFSETGMLTSLIDAKSIILFAVIWIFTNLVKKTKNLHPIIYIGISAVAGIVFSFAGV